MSLSNINPLFTAHSRRVYRGCAASLFCMKGTVPAWGIRADLPSSRLETYSSVRGELYPVTSSRGSACYTSCWMSH